jgi:integrase
MTLFMGIRLFQHRGIWYVEIDGKRRSLKTKDEREAKRFHAQIKREYLAGKLAHLTGQCQKSMRGFYDEFIDWSEKSQPRSTFRANRLALGKLMHFTGETTRLDRITRKHLDQLTGDCMAKRLSIASINNYIRHARTGLNKAVEWQYIQSNPLAGAKELPLDKAPPKFIPKNTAVQFLRKIQDIDRRRLITAYLSTGRRRTELLALRWEHIDFERNAYFIAKGKNHLSKWYPLSAMFKQVLVSIGIQEEGQIFTRWQHPDTLSKIVKKELIAAGMSDLHLHHLRHTFATIKAMEGTPLRILQELLGHTEYRTTERYAHAQEDYLMEHVDINFGPIDLGD